MTIEDPLPTDVFEFDALVTTHDVGGFDYTVVYVPKHVLDRLPMKRFPRLRVVAEICGVPTEAALQPCRGTWYLLIPKRLQKAATIGVGDLASVRFEIADQDFVDVPIKLLHAIEACEAASRAWNALTAGKKRSFAYRVSSAKRESTQFRRVEEIVDELERLEKEEK